MKVLNVQALRGIAALLVVLYHAQNMVNERRAGFMFDMGWAAAGVDIFFCISGFVIVVSTQKYWGDRAVWKDYAAKRAIRIVPLYWIATTCKLVALLLIPAAGQYSSLATWHTIASYLFIPSVNPRTGQIFPLLNQGWTLSFELFFYIIFGVIIGIARRPVFPAAVVLCALSIVGMLKSNDLPAVTVVVDSILMEFVFGMWIGWAALKGRNLPKVAAFVLLPVAIFFFVIHPSMPAPVPHFISAGVPSALILMCAVSLEGAFTGRFERLAALIGDASYAIYLFHTFFISAIGIVWMRVDLSGTTWAWLVVIWTLLISSAAGIVIHLYVEKPLMSLLRRYREKS